METKEFYEKVPVGVLIVGRGPRALPVLYANPAARHMFGVRDDSMARTFEDICPGEEGDALAHRMKSTPIPRDGIVPVRETAGPHRRWAKLSIAEDVFEGQKCLTIWATDISASKEAEEKLQQQVEAADAAAEMKANFLATMSHEIRTPMQSVYGLLELIGEEKPDAKIKTMVDIAKTSASGLLEILDDILDLAKMDAEKMELDSFEVPVRTLVRGILEAMSIKTHGKKIALVDDIAQDVPFVVIGDPKRLRQIIMNLTGNALKFTQEGSVTVRVRKGTATSKSLSLRFEVADTGIGMSEETCKKLFQPFTQADNSTSRKFGGTGLGLSICKRLVDLMGGKIGVESKLDEGSTFWFEIPTQEVGTETTALDLPKLEGISVLSVEDHPQGAREIVRSLESMGAKVETCPSYKEGLELAKRRPFDVAVIDQGLPDGLGLDLIREIMEMRPYMGLIMYTVRDDIGLQHSLQSLGVTYLAKPASRRGLGEAVKDSARRTLPIGTDGPTRLLIAEDTESVRDILQRQLLKLEIEADFVVNGLEALKALQTGKYGILFTDLHMPEMDGYDLVAEIRRQESERVAMRSSGAVPNHFPVVVLTADVQMAQRQVYMDHQFDECLLKPVSLGQLRRLLIRWGLLDPSADDQDGVSDKEPQKTASAAIDRAAIIRQMGALDQNTVDMLGLFVEMTKPVIEKIRAAWENKDTHTLRESAHSLKGSARSACCNALGDAAATLQTAAEDEKPEESMIKKIETEFDRASREIKAIKPE